MIKIRNFLSISVIKNVQTSFKVGQISSLRQFSTNLEKKEDQEKLPLNEVCEKLMSFFDIEENWKKDSVSSGRAWRLDELRIKSNDDLHTLWYVLYKERNMLLTMEEAAKDATENMPSPERIDKVEESMKNIEEVIKERNKAYYQLEVGDDQYVERRRVFRQDMFGRWRWIASSEHLIPMWINKKWRQLYGTRFGPSELDFNRRLREKKLNREIVKIQKQSLYCQQLMRRFPNLDLDYLQELYPNVQVKFLKDNLNENILKFRRNRFNDILFAKSKNL